MKDSLLLDFEETLTAYDQWSVHYDQQENTLLAATAWILDHVPLGVRDAGVIEFGCGTGRHAPRVLAQGARSYLGVDGSEGMLDVARASTEDPRVAWHRADLRVPWQAPDIYDVAMAILILEHFDDLETLLSTIERALAPGGRLRILDLHPARIANGLNARFHREGTELRFCSRAHPPDVLQRALDRIGFDSRTTEWTADDTLITAVPRAEKYRGEVLVLDIEATKR